MKDSGIEWIGLIPDDWIIVKLKHLGQYINGFAFKPDDWGNKGHPIIRIQDLTNSSNNTNFFEGVLPDRYLISDGDILVSWAATLDAFVWSKGRGWLNQHIFKAVPNETLVITEYFYWLIKEAMQNMNNDNKHGIVMQHVTLDVFDNFSVPLPSLIEQRRVAEYLKNKIKCIDRYIEKQQQIIKKLKEYKQAIITEAVTKGLGPNVKMKDSGIEWIGKIPEHWEIRKLRYLGSCVNGISKGGEYFGTGYPFVSYGDVYKNMELPHNVVGLVETTDEEREWYSVKEGDVFFTRTSETIEEVALTSTCMQTIENATFAGFLIRFRPNTDLLSKEFSKYYFRCSKHRLFFVKEMNLVTRASLSQELLKRLPVLLPAIEEQKQIANYLDKICSNIDSVINKKQSIIDRLSEYRKSLIYETVTGKMEV